MSNKTHVLHVLLFSYKLDSNYPYQIVEIEDKVTDNTMKKFDTWYEFPPDSKRPGHCKRETKTGQHWRFGWMPISLFESNGNFRWAFLGVPKETIQEMTSHYNACLAAGRVYSISDL